MTVARPLPDEEAVEGCALSGVPTQPVRVDPSENHFWLSCASTFFCHLLGLGCTLLFFNSHRGKVGATTGLALAALKMSVLSGIAAIIVAHTMPGHDYRIDAVHSAEMCDSLDGEWVPRGGYDGDDHHHHHRRHHPHHGRFNAPAPTMWPHGAGRDAMVTNDHSEGGHHHQHGHHHGQHHGHHHQGNHHPSHHQRHHQEEVVKPTNCTKGAGHHGGAAGDEGHKGSWGEERMPPLPGMPQEPERPDMSEMPGMPGRQHSRGHAWEGHPRPPLPTAMWVKHPRVPEEDPTHFCDCPPLAWRVPEDGGVVCRNSIGGYICGAVAFICMFAALMGLRFFLISQERRREVQQAFSSL